MGAFGIDSTANLTNAQTATTDQGRSVRGTSAQYTETGGIAVGSKSNLTVNEEGSVSGRDNQTGGVSAKGNIAYDNRAVTTTNVNTSDPEVAKTAISSVSSLSDKFSQTIGDILGSQSASQTATLASLASLSGSNTSTAAASNDAKVASDATGGISNFNKPLIILGLGLLAVAALFFLKRK